MLWNGTNWYLSLVSGSEHCPHWFFFFPRKKTTKYCNAVVADLDVSLPLMPNEADPGFTYAHFGNAVRIKKWGDNK